METIIGHTIHNTVVRIDNKSFVNCDLSGCTLEYAGEPVSFQVTRLRNCRYIFFGAAKRTVVFLQETGLMPFDERDWGEAGEETGQEPGQAPGSGSGDGHADGKTDGKADGDGRAHGY